MTNALGKILGFFWNPFSHLPKDADRKTIFGAAGELFAARRANNQWVDFDTEIWYLAGDAMRRGFYDLSGWTKRQVASEMGDSIASYIRSQRKDPPPQGQGYRDSF